VYEVIGDPPLLAGALHETDVELDEANVADTDVGAVDTVYPNALASEPL
jgi:hypothetical protein